MRSSHPDDPVRAAVTNLAERLAVPTGSVEVAEVEEVVWRDSSLGCPEPDRMYAAVISPGHRITLRASGRTYRYHAGEGRAPFLCGGDDGPAAAG